jgi:small-conductance mechanosensitive channel
VKKTLLVTHVRTIKNVVVSIPNSLVINSPVVNYATLAAERGLILHTAITIGYDAPWRTIHELMIAAALATPGIERQPAPFVWQTSLNDFYVTYEINAFTREPHRMMEIYAELHANIQDKFFEAGVEIMSPHYYSLRDGNRTAIPDAFLPDGYEPPGFKVR